MTSTITHPDVSPVLNIEAIQNFRLLPGLSLLTVAPKKVIADRDQYVNGVLEAADRSAEEMLNAEAPHIARSYRDRAVQLKLRADRISKMGATSWLSYKKSLVK